MLKSKVCRLCGASFVPELNEEYCKDCLKINMRNEKACVFNKNGFCVSKGISVGKSFPKCIYSNKIKCPHYEKYKSTGGIL